MAVVDRGTSLTGGVLLARMFIGELGDGILEKGLA